MKRLFLVACLCGLCSAPASFAQRRGDNVYTGHELTRRNDGRLRPQVRRSPIRALLLKPVEKVSWDEAPFREVVEWLRLQRSERQNVNVVVKWPALAAESIDPESPVTLDMEGTTVAEVLDEVLDQLSDLEPITYIGINNRLKISTQVDFDRKLYTRVYNIDDIFFKIRNFTGSPQIDLNQQQQNTGGGGGGGSSGQARVQSIFGQGGGGGGNDDDSDDEDEDDEREEEIIDWIRTTVEPDSWQDNGGLGSLAIFNKMLTVRNTLGVHELLGGPFHISE
ncbi:MAG: hypothetical protein ACE5EX_07405 [Phycisphaerae bacterium]